MGPDVSWRLTKSQLLWRLSKFYNKWTFWKCILFEKLLQYIQVFKSKKCPAYIIKFYLPMYYISNVCNICLFFGIIGWFFKNRMQNQKNIPFWPRVHYIYVSNIGPCTFFLQKKKEKEMQWKVSEKSSFHFWSANALIAFVTNVEYQDGKKILKKN